MGNRLKRSPDAWEKYTMAYLNNVYCGICQDYVDISRFEAYVCYKCGKPFCVGKHSLEELQAHATMDELVKWGKTNEETTK